MSTTQTVLVIDDSQMIHRLVAVHLKDLKVTVHGVETAHAGIEAAQNNPDVILLDVDLPDMSGFQVCEQLKQDPKTRDIPIIFLTGSDDRTQKLRGFELGAVDYITKPFDAAELCARVGAALRTQALLEQMETQARTDDLTGLPNRHCFAEALAHTVDESAKENGHDFAVLFLDLDRFKVVNDSLGHDIGDQLLITIAKRLRQTLASFGRGGQFGDIIARMGGDEFTILLPSLDEPDLANRLAEQLCADLTTVYQIEGHAINTGVSIGVRICSGTSCTADALLRDSDTAMYEAKENGKGGWVVFDEQMHHRVLQRLQLEQELRDAVGTDQFILHYQPIMSLETGQLRGFEALVRWQHPQRGLVSPALFVPLSEEIGVINQLGADVLQQACRTTARWNKMHPTIPPIKINVNLSKRQIEQPDLIERIQEIVQNANLPIENLVLEVTESTIMHNPDSVVPVLEKLRDIGITLAMDNFGTGYSSLASLHEFPISILKIDRAFIKPMTQSRSYSAIVQAILTLAGNLDMAVVAEGIETHDQLVQLQALECSHAQGFFFSKPLPEHEAQNFIFNGTTDIAQSA